MAQTFSVSLDKIATSLNLELLSAPKKTENIQITTSEVNRPGLLLAGYDDYFEKNRIQIMGNAEFGYLESLDPDDRRNAIHALFRVKPPAVILTRENAPMPVSSREPSSMHESFVA